MIDTDVLPYIAQPLSTEGNFFFSNRESLYNTDKFDVLEST